MTAGMAIEVGVLTTIAGGSLWNCNYLEDNAKKFPNSIIAFMLVIGGIIVAIWSASLAAMMVKTGEMSMPTGFPAFSAAVLLIMGKAAQLAGLLDPAIRKTEQEPDSLASVGPVVCMTVTDADDDDILAGERLDRIREREFKAMRPVSNDTDEHTIPVDDNAVTANRN
jgi:hypothetical protein